GSAEHGGGVEQEHIAGAVETRTRGCVCARCGQNDAARPHQTRKEDQDRYYQGRCSLLLLERIPQIYPSLRAKRKQSSSGSRVNPDCFIAIATALLRRICRLLAHRDVSLPRAALVAIEGIADMNGRGASARSAEIDPKWSLG